MLAYLFDPRRSSQRDRPQPRGSHPTRWSLDARLAQTLGIDGERDRWRVELEPSSFTDVTVSLPAGSNCSSDPCTADNRALWTAVSTSITGSAPTSLTAEFASVPSTHDGSAFDLELVFSDVLAPQSRSKLLSSLALTGATLVNVSTVTEGVRDHWQIELDPTSDER